MSAQDTITPNIDQERCTGCGDCIDTCPEGALALESGHVVMVHPRDCRYCSDCEELCPVGAIARPFEIILSDKAHQKRR